MKKSIIAFVLIFVLLTTSMFFACSKKPSEEPEYPMHEHNFVDGRCTICGETEGIQYTLQADDTYLVSGYEGTQSEVYLSNVHNGKLVTGIADNGFCNIDNVIHILLAAGMKTIGNGAFSNCKRLRYIYLPDTIETVGSSILENSLGSCDVCFWGTKEQWDAITKADNWASDEIKNSVRVIFGSPWTTTVIMNNHPTEQPRVQDDIYTYYNFDFMKKCEVYDSNSTMGVEREMKQRYAEMINDSTISDPELNNLRVLYNQIADKEEIKKYGLETIKPYIDRIDAVTSIEQFNELLLADDFWFSPFIFISYYMQNSLDKVMPVISQNSTYLEEDNIYFYGAYDVDYLGDVYWWSRLQTKIDFELLGMDSDEANKVCNKIMTFEKKLYNDSLVILTYDELDSWEVPIVSLVQKYGIPLKDGAVVAVDYLDNLEDVWNNENLDMLKLITKTRVLFESRLYRDNSIYDEAKAQNTQADLGSIAELAIDACDSRFTFSDVIAKSFVKYRFSEEDLTRLHNLANDVVVAYKELLGKTEWLNSETKNTLIKKLDNLRVCMLSPMEGYLDYSGITLSSSDAPLENYLKLKKYRYYIEAQEFVGQTNISLSWIINKPTENNCFYNQKDNSINIAVGHMLYSVYNSEMSEVELFGKLGATIAHEVGHGLVGVGSYYNEYGVRVDSIYKDEDNQAYNNLCQKVINYLNSIEVKDGMYVNGDYCLSEMTADLLSGEAMIQVMKDKGYSNYGDFAKAYAESWALVIIPNYFDYYYYDSHPFNNIRTNVTLQMLNEICDYYGFKEGDAMYLAPENRVVFFG